jgi:hypothetical protein
MVFVGHSMGGLIAKMLTIDSGDDFWHLASREPIQQVKFSPETRATLQDLFYFTAQPCVRRVVFLATPHHGSKLSPSLPARLAEQFIHLPKDLRQTAHEASREDPHLLAGLGKGRVPTSLDLLAPGAPALELLAARPKPPGVHYHSIIGEIFGKGRDGSDGVVPYTSAHLDGVDSEVVVPASHLTVHNHPRAVLEVWRILLEHLREASGRSDFPPPLPEVTTAATSPLPGVFRR